MFLFQLFHQRSKFDPANKAAPRPRSEWPHSWTTTYYKVYERFISKKLGATLDLSLSVGDAIAKRHSSREYPHMLSTEHLSTLLKYTSGELDPNAVYGQGRRACASAGARYPIETYVLLFKAAGDFVPGTYHYDVQNHALVNLRAPQLDEKLRTELLNYPESVAATGVLVYTGVFVRETEKYGERGYRHTLLEAGGIGAQCYLVSGALGIGCVAMSGYQDRALEAHLAIDGVTESVVHAVVFG
jgi:SagB-type dehydrogenase family enzyme